MSAIAKLLWLLLALGLFSFAALAVNQSAVALRFLIWETPEISLFWWLLCAFVLGFVLASIGYGLVALRVRVQNRLLNKRLHKVEQENRQLEQHRDPLVPTPDPASYPHS